MQSTVNITYTACAMSIHNYDPFILWVIACHGAWYWAGIITLTLLTAVSHKTYRRSDVAT